MLGILAVLVTVGMLVQRYAFENGVPDVPPAERQLINAVRSEVASGQIDAVLARLPTGSDRNATRATLSQLHGAMNDLGPEQRLTVLSSARGLRNGDRTVEVADRVDYQTATLLVRTRFVIEANGDARLETFTIAPMDPSEASFLPAVSSVGHAVLLVMMLGSMAFMLHAVVETLHAPGLRKRWMIVVLALVALPGLSFGWDQVEEFRLGMGLIGNGIVRDLGGVWVANIGVPTGAVVALILVARHRRRLDAGQPAQSPEQSPGQSEPSEQADQPEPRV